MEVEHNTDFFQQQSEETESGSEQLEELSQHSSADTESTREHALLLSKQLRAAIAALSPGILPAVFLNSEKSQRVEADEVPDILKPPGEQKDQGTGNLEELLKKFNNAPDAGDRQPLFQYARELLSEPTSDETKARISSINEQLARYNRRMECDKDGNFSVLDTRTGQKLMDGSGGATGDVDDLCHLIATGETPAEQRLREHKKHVADLDASQVRSSDIRDMFSELLQMKSDMHLPTTAVGGVLHKLGVGNDLFEKIDDAIGKGNGSINADKLKLFIEQESRKKDADSRAIAVAGTLLDWPESHLTKKEFVKCLDSTSLKLLNAANALENAEAIFTGILNKRAGRPTPPTPMIKELQEKLQQSPGLTRKDIESFVQRDGGKNPAIKLLYDNFDSVAAGKKTIAYSDVASYPTRTRQAHEDVIRFGCKLSKDLVNPENNALIRKK